MEVKDYLGKTGLVRFLENCKTLFVPKGELATAVDDALAQAKESGEFDGKSAYEYAQEGGYTGSETAFATKLAEQSPSAQINVHNSDESAHADIRAAIEGKANKSEGTFYIEGSGTTDSTNKISTWTGTSDRITSLYDGLTIRYKIGIEGQTTTTLNINGLGAKTVYRFSESKLTTQFPVGSIINLIYHEDLNDGCWMCNDYDANTNTQQRVYSTTSNVEYPITTRYNTTTGSSYYAEYGRYSSGVTLNPSTKTITATAFKGKLTGNADTATKAIQDDSGNVITATYETKENAAEKLNEVNSQISQLSSEIADQQTDIDSRLKKNFGANNVGKILVVGTDGNLTLADMPEGGASGDVVGTLDESNNILLSGSLADGTYTLKYANSDGTSTVIGTLEVGAIQPAFINQIPISINEDGSLFVGTNGEKGYKTNYRISMSGGGESAAEGSEVTGFIPATRNSVIRIKNIAYEGDATRGVVGYNANFQKVTNVNGIALQVMFAQDGTDEGNGVIRSKVLGEYTHFKSDDLKYIRLASTDISENSIITIDQEIV